MASRCSSGSSVVVLCSGGCDVENPRYAGLLEPFGSVDESSRHRKTCRRHEAYGIRPCKHSMAGVVKKTSFLSRSRNHEDRPFRLDISAIVALTLLTSHFSPLTAHCSPLIQSISAHIDSMNSSRSLLRLGRLARRSQPAILRSFSSSIPTLSSSSPPRAWTPTPFVTETVVCQV